MKIGEGVEALVTRKLEFYREHVGAWLILCDFLSTPRNIDNARRCRFSIPYTQVEGWFISSYRSLRNDRRVEPILFFVRIRSNRIPNFLPLSSLFLERSFPRFVDSRKGGMLIDEWSDKQNFG